MVIAMYVHRLRGGGRARGKFECTVEGRVGVLNPFPWVSATAWNAPPAVWLLRRRDRQMDGLHLPYLDRRGGDASAQTSVDLFLPCLLTWGAVDVLALWFDTRARQCCS